MKVNYRRLAAGRESVKHYDCQYSSKEGRRQERRSADNRREVREALAHR